ncbi:carbohydrate kinase family protein [Candidatus Cryosericum septentrionale]|jgi:ribokinase|uniref:Carbohydrate kinase family protein n=1 Tax=Candidatus Cryosericum septentrionale TaxID=2290913 RepID=A0A398DXN7_9BACT|nr:carbohydrate kinase family protein [Candidatus Cryosericum septentrionale]RIE16074.1 carbohydrate kinase family protein [Candidatus Cryosericum septentrionale]
MFFVTGDLNIDATTVAPTLSLSGKEAQADLMLSCGGQGGNVAFFLRCLDRPVQLFGTLGTDAAGDLYAVRLAHLGITYAGNRVDEPTGMVSVVQEAGSYHMYRQRGANAAVDPAAFTRFVHSACKTAGDFLFVSGYSLLEKGCWAALGAVLTSSALARPVVVMDPASIDAMNSMGRDAVLGAARLCDYLLPNEEEACWLAQEADAREAAGILHRSTGTTIVVKLGARGALLCSDEGIIMAPGAALTPVDVTGAGDSFAAALLSALATGAGPQTALDTAVRFSGAKVQLAGTQPLELLGYSG